MSEPAKTRRRIALITGAAGGMGRACARLLGRRYRLAPMDIGQERLDALAASLVEEGLEIALTARCDIGLREEAAALARALGRAGDLGAVAHTAGLSPVLASWKPIIQVNLVGTALRPPASASTGGFFTGLTSREVSSWGGVRVGW